MISKIQTTNYKNYPECMFAVLSAFVPEEQANVFRRIAGDAVFRHEENGKTYKNGLLHSFDDLPAVNEDGVQMWYRDGLIHRDGDLPAHIDGDLQEWFKNNVLHREGDKPALICGQRQEWYNNGICHREGDLPAIINGDYQEWYKNGELYREGGLPSVIQGNQGGLFKDGVYLSCILDENGNWDFSPIMEQAGDYVEEGDYVQEGDEDYGRRYDE